jgi:hypothetical protein
MSAKLLEHEKNCYIHGEQRIQFPEDDIVKFRNIKHQMLAPWIIFADCESILKKLAIDPDANSNKYQHHIACSWSYKIVSNVSDTKYEMRYYFGTNALQKFIESLLWDLKNIILPSVGSEAEMIWNDEDIRKFQSATHCHICEKKLTVDDPTVRDHCHFTGVFRGAAHNSCNLQYQISKNYTLPIVIHNSRAYDTHLIVQAIKKEYGRIRLIPNNMERYISLQIGKLRFIDSFQFLPFALADLTKNVKDFKHLKEHYTDENQFKLLTKKGVFPYDYMENMDRFRETRLPSQSDFYNQLNEKPLSDAEYLHAQEVWNTFNCKTMKDYHDIYLLSDVLLLADCFEEFRNECYSAYKLDPANYFSLPGYSWDCALKYSDVKLQLITDIDMYQMVEKGIRGGVCSISQRYSKSNNRYMKDYDPQQKTNTNIYMDANALYACAMCKYLPTSEFEWINVEDIPNFENVPADSDYGYILEADLEYPEHLHDAHNCYPLAADHLIITRDMLSTYQQELYPKFANIKKLVPNLMDKNKYVCHYENLKLYTSLGMVVKRVHRALKFKQTPWLAGYINFNTIKRQQAAAADDEIGKVVYKLMNNAVSIYFYRYAYGGLMHHLDYGEVLN